MVYGNTPRMKEAKKTHPFPLATHTCYLHVIPFPNSGLHGIMHKPIGLLTAPGRLTADPLNLMTRVIKYKQTHEMDVQFPSFFVQTQKFFNGAFL